MPPRIGRRTPVRRPNHLRAWREKLVGSQERLLARLSEMNIPMSKASLSRMEGGQQAISDEAAEALAEALGVEPYMIREVDPESDAGGLYADIARLPAEDRSTVQNLIARLSKQAS